MKKLLWSLLFVTACVLQLVSPLAQGQTSTATLYEGARLIVGDGSGPIEDSAFVVERGRFTRVGRKGEVQAPAGAARVDLTGKTVMPGMIDTHNHLGPSRQDYIDQLNSRAYFGIAAVTSMGHDTDFAFQVRSEYLSNGARLLASGRGMVGPLGTLPVTMNNGVRLPEDLRDEAVQVGTEKDARLHVQELAMQNVDFIKIWVDDRGGLEKMMSPNVYRALIDEAHKHNLRVFAHMWGLEESKELLRAGLDSLVHAIRDKDVDDELIQLLKERPNVFCGTTLQGAYMFTLKEDPAWFKDPLLLDIVSPSEIKQWSAKVLDPTTHTHEGWPSDVPKVIQGQKVYGFITRNLAKLYKAGVPFAIGTEDKAGNYGFGIHLEMELLVKDAGLTPSQVIKMATQDGARALHLDDLGTVAAGKTASFVVLNANPLDDITNTRRIAKVYLRGNEVDRAGFKKTRSAHDSQ